MTTNGSAIAIRRDMLRFEQYMSLKTGLLIRL